MKLSVLLHFNRRCFSKKRRARRWLRTRRDVILKEGVFFLDTKSFPLCFSLLSGQSNISSKIETHFRKSGEMICPVSLIILYCYFNRTLDNCH